MTARSSVVEDDASLHSGLRTRSLIGLAVIDLEKIVEVVGLTESATWVPLTVTGSRFLPQTPCVWIDQAPTLGNVVEGQIRFQVLGYNRFGEQIRETTPWGTFEALDNNYLFLATAFHIVTEVSYQCDAGGTLDPATTISVGVFPNFARVEDATHHYVWGENFGIGLPMRPGRIPTHRFVKGATAAADGFVTQDPFDVVALNLQNQTTSVVWRVGDNLVVGRNASGFPVEDNKVTVTDFALVTNELTGAAAAYVLTDALRIGIVMHSSRTKIAGHQLNDVLSAH